ncbi:hypothetical protein BH10PSE15_BH10PSE15_06300 [soil metagenome]
MTLDIDETVEVVHDAQQLSFWNGHYGERCFLPIHVYDSPVEGQIDRVKAIKRQMYGRAKYPLLKQRVLIAA